MHPSRTLPIVIALLMPLAANAQSAKPALYTDAQAQAGAGVYSQACGACHGQQLEGVAADALLDVIANTMPQSDPGSLKPDDYNAVTAYILQQNGYPSGGTALAKDEAGLKDTKVTP